MVLSLNILSVKISPAESVVLGRAGGCGEEPTGGCGDLVSTKPRDEFDGMRRHFDSLNM